MFRNPKYYKTFHKRVMKPITLIHLLPQAQTVASNFAIKQELQWYFSLHSQDEATRIDVFMLGLGIATQTMALTNK